VKLLSAADVYALISAFSILERIDVGETLLGLKLDNLFKFAFSILERIDVGETIREAGVVMEPPALSVSSNGSTWVKRRCRK